MNHVSIRQRVLLCSLLGLLAGCSGVRVLKVSGTPEPEGIPFYLPRPYVQVFEPFVIGSNAYIVAGQLSSDGQYLLIDNVKDQALLGGLFQSDLSKEVGAKIPMKIVRRAQSKAPATGRPLGDEATDQEPGKSPADSQTPAEPASPSKPGTNTPDSSDGGSQSKPDKSEPATASSGNSSIKVVNTSAIFPPTLGRRFFDVVWMPDFDEKYVVQSTPGLGSANIGVTMTQGWGLYGLDALVDNRDIVKPLLNFYGTSFDALGKLARSKIFPAGELTGGAPEGGKSLATESLPPGSRVSVKVTKVQIVAPGLYPILKPNEAAKTVDPAADKAGLGKRHLPLRPYTNIAFNTYEVVVVEAAKPSGDTPMNLQRYFDSTGPAGSGGIATSPEQGQQPFDVEEFETRINGLLANRKGPGQEVWQLSGLKADGSKLKGTIALVGGKQKPPSLSSVEQVRAFVAEQSGGLFKTSDVELVEKK